MKNKILTYVYERVCFWRVWPESKLTIFVKALINYSTLREPYILYKEYTIHTLATFYGSQTNSIRRTIQL